MDKCIYILNLTFINELLKFNIFIRKLDCMYRSLSYNNISVTVYAVMESLMKSTTMKTIHNYLESIKAFVFIFLQILQ